MSEPAPNRAVSGLPPRRSVTGDLSNLQAKNRNAVESDSPPVGQSESVGTANGGERKPKRITVYIDPDVFTRARGVFKATAHLENDKSWSQFVDKALAREAQAREIAYNDGARYEDSNVPLTAGRPLSS